MDTNGKQESADDREYSVVPYVSHYLIADTLPHLRKPKNHINFCFCFDAHLCCRGGRESLHHLTHFILEQTNTTGNQLQWRPLCQLQAPLSGKQIYLYIYIHIPQFTHSQHELYFYHNLPSRLTLSLSVTLSISIFRVSICSRYPSQLRLLADTTNDWQ